MTMSPKIDDAPPVLGARLRRRRQALRLTLKEVAASAGLSEGHLSQVERGVTNASVGTLQRLCQSLGLSVGALFEEPSNSASPVTRFTDAAGLSFGDHARKVRVTPSHFDRLEVLVGAFDPGGSTGVEAYAHGNSEEVLVVVSGSVDVTVDGQTHHLGPLDSIHYHSGSPHKVAEAAGGDAVVVWAMSPPTY